MSHEHMTIPEPPRGESDPTAAELALLQAAFARVELFPEAPREEPAPFPGAEKEIEETAAFLKAVRRLDSALEKRLGRNRRRFRGRLRRRIYAEDLAPLPGNQGYVARGMVLAWQYARLRLRESKAVRVAAVLLVLHLLAVPVAALMVKVENQRQERIYRFDVAPEELRFEDSRTHYEFHEDVPEGVKERVPFEMEIDGTRR